MNVVAVGLGERSADGNGLHKRDECDRRGRGNELCEERGVDSWHVEARQARRDLATPPLSTAYAWFRKLQVPKWVERTEQLAQEYGITLQEVELEELTEGEV